jgi:arylsulfatase A-like enzyme
VSHFSEESAAKAFWCCACLGTAAGYLYLLFFLLAGLVEWGELPSWGSLGNTFEAALRYFSAGLFLIPLVGAVAGAVAGGLVLLVDWLLKLREEPRRALEITAVGVVCFAVLGLPLGGGSIFASWGALLRYLALLALGAGFVWAARSGERALMRVGRVCTFVLAGSALVWALFCFLLPVGFEPGGLPADEPPGPNIVVVLSDAHRADVNSAYGGRVPAPNLERLAERGVLFERCFAPSNWTIPGVIGLFSGLCPEAADSDSNRSTPPTIPMLPEELQSVGYRTWTTIANPALSMRYTLNRGWDYYALLSVRYYLQGLLEDASVSGYTRLAGGLSSVLVRLFYENYRVRTPELGLRMLEGLNPAGGDFVYIHLNDPHTPYRPYERYRPAGPERVGRYRYDTWEHDLTKNDLSDLTPEEIRRIRELYEGEVRFSDEYLGLVLDVMDERDLWGDTVLVFCADHGEEFGEHGSFTHGHTNLHHELTHVPLVVYWPGVFEGGERVAAPVSLLDFYPTVHELLYLPYEPEFFNGRPLSLSPDPGRAIFAQRYPNKPGELRRSDFVVLGEAALYVDYTTGTEELYLDYHSRPVDVSAEHPALVDELRGLLEDFHAANAELQTRYGTALGEAPVNPAMLENLRAIGYIQ